jgi:hypothetical protein
MIDIRRREMLDMSVLGMDYRIAGMSRGRTHEELQSRPHSGSEN